MRRTFHRAPILSDVAAKWTYKVIVCNRAVNRNRLEVSSEPQYRFFFSQLTGRLPAGSNTRFNVSTLSPGAGRGRSFFLFFFLELAELVVDSEWGNSAKICNTRYHFRVES